MDYYLHTSTPGGGFIRLFAGTGTGTMGRILGLHDSSATTMVGHRHGGWSFMAYCLRRHSHDDC